MSQVLKAVSKSSARASGARGARPASTFGRGRVTAGVAGLGLGLGADARRVVVKSRFVVLRRAGSQAVAATRLRCIEREGSTGDGRNLAQPRAGKRGQATNMALGPAAGRVFLARSRRGHGHRGGVRIGDNETDFHSQAKISRRHIWMLLPREFSPCPFGNGRSVLERYYRELLNFCTRVVKDRDAAAEVVQESYARVLAIQQSRVPISEPRALLYQTARHVMVDQHRRELLRSHDDLGALEEAKHPPVAAHMQPEALLASSQAIEAYVATIEALPPRCREAFLLHVFDGLPHAEIAERMGASVSMVEKHIARGRLACRACQLQLQGRPLAEEVSKGV